MSLQGWRRLARDNVSVLGESINGRGSHTTIHRHKLYLISGHSHAGQPFEEHGRPGKRTSCRCCIASAAAGSKEAQSSDIVALTTAPIDSTFNQYTPRFVQFIESGNETTLGPILPTSRFSRATRLWTTFPFQEKAPQVCVR